MIEASIGELCEIVKGETGIMKAIPGQYPLVVTGADRKSSSTFQFDDEAVCIPLVSSTGHGHKSLNYVHYQSGKFALGTILAAVIPKDKSVLSAEYLQRYLQFNKDRVLVPLMTGAANVTLSMKNIAKVSVPIPSIEKQHNYIDLINRIENKQLNLNTEFNTQSSYLTQLRQAILQEAIEGKLTADWRKENPVCKGDPDYDAEALLKKIKAEKEKLVKEGKIKKQKPLAPIKTEEVPFDLPEGWVWTRLGEICDSIKYGTSEKCSYEMANNAKVLRIPNVSSGIINDDDLKYTHLSQKDLQELSLKQGDILTIRSNGSPEIVGTMALVTDEFENYCYAGYLIRLRFVYPLLGEFISKISRAKYIRSQIEDPLRTTVGINNINTQELSNLYFPLPAITEQRAIIKRIEKLFLMVNELEKQVSERKEQSEQLMQAVLREALEG